jgi:hypothetical protein
MDLANLHRRVQDARRQFEEPPTAGSSKPILPLTEYFDRDAHALLREAVRALRHDHPAEFVNYPEPTVAWFIVEELARHETAPSLADLANRLADQVEQDEGPWLVSTPLANIELADPMIELADDVVLWRAELGTEWLDQRYPTVEDNSEFAVFHILGDRLPRPTRWKRLPADERLDARVGATLLSVERATIGLAVARARSKARYAIASWAVLAPPDGDRLVPDVATWVPQPTFQITEPYKRLEDRNWIPKERSSLGSVRLWRPYEAPASEILRLPFAAMSNLQHRSAQAVLSASLSLLQASRGTRFTLSERLRYVHSALDALCEPAKGRGGIPRRWAKIAEHYRVWAHLAELGYQRDEIETAQTRLYAARNIATHGRDAVLVDIGYPPGAVREINRGTLSGVDLGLSGLESDLTPLLSAVRHVLRGLWDDLHANWSDTLFDSRFS